MTWVELGISPKNCISFVDGSGQCPNHQLHNLPELLFKFKNDSTIHNLNAGPSEGGGAWGALALPIITRTMVLRLLPMVLKFFVEPFLILHVN